jgi:metallo-beta-lactamase family protein
MKAELFFHGAAETVTGSCYRLVHDDAPFLVDCGLFQGSKTLNQLNYDAFPFDPESLAFVLLTHAHIDHSGLIPKLYRHGFTGPVYATEGTRDLLTYMLPDTAFIQETEVKRLNHRNRQRGKPEVEPVYDRADAEKALENIQPVELEEWFVPAPEATEGRVRARFWNAGHILGSASIEVEIATGDGKPLRLLFSGDIGPEEKAFHRDPMGPTDLDYLISESTYGDRERPELRPEERREVLRRELEAGLKNDGTVLIPAFAVERTQELLYDIGVLMDVKALPRTRVFLDSPLAIRATQVFEHHADALEEKDFKRQVFHNRNFRFVESADESKGLARMSGGAIIIAASGMCDAGRIRHHLMSHLWRNNATVLFVGYQVPGTLGRLLRDGTKKVRIHGKEIQVNARIRVLESYSAHADKTELKDWICERLPVRGALFLTHGEPDAMDALKEALKETGCRQRQIILPRIGESFRLTGRGRPARGAGVPVFPGRHGPQTDRHNDYAAFLLALGETLRDSETNGERIKLLRRLTRAVTPK